MPDYSVPQGREMSQLRQDAIRRAREMQSRAQIPVGHQQPEPVPESPPPEPPPAPVQETPPQQDNTPHPHTEQMPVHPRQNSGMNRKPEPQAFGGALDFLTKDPERAIILVLMLILMEEKADNSLLFAMMYLLS